MLIHQLSGVWKCIACDGPGGLLAKACRLEKKRETRLAGGRASQVKDVGGQGTHAGTLILSHTELTTSTSLRQLRR